jgi:hypothetical protein
MGHAGVSIPFPPLNRDAIMPTFREPPPVLPPRSPLAGILSFLVPGLGQIYQGRISKGVLFLACLYGLFFTGMAMGNWSNVYLPDTSKANLPLPVRMPPTAANIYNRLHFAGQFWIGVASWPAIWQYMNEDRKEENIFGSFQRTPSEDEINKMQRDSDKTWDLGWIYTVIAGVLNILVIYDAYAGPAFAEGELMQERARKEGAVI